MKNGVRILGLSFFLLIFSCILPARVNAATPSAPLNLSVIQGTLPKNITFNYVAPIDDGGFPLLKYEFSFRKPGQSWQVLTLWYLWTTSPSYTFSDYSSDDIQYDKTYDFRVRGLNENSEYGDYSNIFTYTLPAARVHHVSSCQELEDINSLIWADWTAASDIYKLDNNIDCSATATWNPVAGSPGVYEGFKPIYELMGIFDGQGHTISGLYMNYTASAGPALFNTLAYDATIRDLNIDSATLIGSYMSGTLGDFVLPHSVITVANVQVTNTSVTADSSTGGLIGYCEGGGSISDSSFSGSVHGNNYIGGLIGENYGDMDDYLHIVNSSNAGTVTAGAGDMVGGIVGYGNFMTITGSHNSGNVSSTGSNVGGIAGTYYYSDISNTTNTGQVATNYDPSVYVGGWSGAGGLLGDCFIVNISDSVNQGSLTVSRGENAGGLCGTGNEVTIDHSYNSGQITADILAEGNNGVGGLLGNTWSGTIRNSYNQGNVTGKYSVGGLLGSGHTTTLLNSYNSGIVTDQDGLASGGLIGTNKTNPYLPDPPILEIRNSFNAGPVSGLGASINGGLVGFISDDPGRTTTFEHAMWSGDLANGIGNNVIPNVTGQYEKVASADFFKNNTSNQPLNNWDFSSLWGTNSGQFPTFNGYHGNVTPTPTITNTPAPTRKPTITPRIPAKPANTPTPLPTITVTELPATGSDQITPTNIAPKTATPTPVPSKTSSDTESATANNPSSIWCCLSLLGVTVIAIIILIIKRKKSEGQAQRPKITK